MIIPILQAFLSSNQMQLFLLHRSLAGSILRKQPLLVCFMNNIAHLIFILHYFIILRIFANALSSHQIEREESLRRDAEHYRVMVLFNFFCALFFATLCFHLHFLYYSFLFLFLVFFFMWFFFFVFFFFLSFFLHFFILRTQSFFAYLTASNPI